jgi:hypothetical protein
VAHAMPRWFISWALRSTASSFRTRGRPQDLVAAGGSVWVATTEPNELVRFSSSGAP